MLLPCSGEEKWEVERGNTDREEAKGGGGKAEREFTLGNTVYYHYYFNLLQNAELSEVWV